MTIATCTSLDNAPHRLPVVRAIRDHSVGFLELPQGAANLNRGLDLLVRPFIVVLGDDSVPAPVPGRYDPVTLERLIGMIDGVAIIAGVPPAEAYASIAMMAIEHCYGLIIETRREQETDWTNLVKAVRHDMPIMVCTARVLH